jgi:hypothetical protein
MKIQARIFKMQPTSSYVPSLFIPTCLSLKVLLLSWSFTSKSSIVSHRTLVHNEPNAKLKLLPNCLLYQKVHAYDMSVHNQNYFTSIYWKILILCCTIFLLCVNETFTVLRRNGLIYLYLHKYITLELLLSADMLSSKYRVYRFDNVHK